MTLFKSVWSRVAVNDSWRLAAGAVAPTTRDESPDKCTAMSKFPLTGRRGCGFVMTPGLLIAVNPTVTEVDAYDSPSLDFSSIAWVPTGNSFPGKVKKIHSSNAPRPLDVYELPTTNLPPITRLWFVFGRRPSAVKDSCLAPIIWFDPTTNRPPITRLCHVFGRTPWPLNPSCLAPIIWLLCTMSGSPPTLGPWVTGSGISWSSENVGGRFGIATPILAPALVKLPTLTSINGPPHSDEPVWPVVWVL